MSRLVRHATDHISEVSESRKPRLRYANKKQSNLKATAASTIQLAWADKSDNESGFAIQRKNGACDTGAPGCR